MSIEQVRNVADILGGEPFPRDDEDGWFVLLARPDGRFVVVSDSAVEEYFDRESVDGGRYYACISLT